MSLETLAYCRISGGSIVIYEGSAVRSYADGCLFFIAFLIASLSIGNFLPRIFSCRKYIIVFFSSVFGVVGTTIVSAILIDPGDAPKVFRCVYPVIAFITIVVAGTASFMIASTNRRVAQAQWPLALMDADQRSTRSLDVVLLCWTSASLTLGGTIYFGKWFVPDLVSWEIWQLNEILFLFIIPISTAGAALTSPRHLIRRRVRIGAFLMASGLALFISFFRQ